MTPKASTGFTSLKWESLAINRSSPPLRYKEAQMDRRFQHRNALTRRSFLAAIPAVAAVSLPVANGEGKLAADGGTPVRATRLTTEYPGTQLYDEQERGELTEAYDSHSLFRFYGPTKPRKVATFEKELAVTMGAKYALAVTSGTAALHCSLAAIGVGPGEEVILPAWTWHSCYMAILMTGALPVFAEVDESFSMDPKDLGRRLLHRQRL